MSVRDDSPCSGTDTFMLAVHGKKIDDSAWNGWICRNCQKRTLLNIIYVIHPIRDRL